jgi:hypothetical protein
VYSYATQDRLFGNELISKQVVKICNISHLFSSLESVAMNMNLVTVYLNLNFFTPPLRISGFWETSAISHSGRCWMACRLPLDN